VRHEGKTGESGGLNLIFTAQNKNKKEGRERNRGLAATKKKGGGPQRKIREKGVFPRRYTRNQGGRGKVNHRIEAAGNEVVKGTGLRMGEIQNPKKEKKKETARRGCGKKKGRTVEVPQTREPQRRVSRVGV